MPRYDPADVKLRARNRWAEILAAVAGLPPDSLDGDHHPCPKCGGVDRFRFTDRDGDGSLLCNACARRQCGDGIAAVQWALGCDFPTALARVAEHIGAPEHSGACGHGHRTRGPQSATRARKPPADPSEHLEFLPWSDLLIALFCSRKQPITPEAIKAVGGTLARYRKQYTVVALPVCGPELDHSKPVGWVIYNVTGGKLPAWKKDGAVEWVKVKTLPGTKPGLIGGFNR